MNPGELIRRANRLQRARAFKIAASIGLALLFVGVFVTMFTLAREPESASRVATAQAEAAQQVRGVFESGPIGAARAAYRTVLLQMATGPGVGASAAGFAAALGVSLVVVWLGLGATYLFWLLVAWGVAWPLTAYEPTAWAGELLLALAPLALTFLTLVELARLSMFPSHPVTAVARNVLNEAVRMKVSIVFIIILLLLMATVPVVLQEDQPLRYRVQQWLSYGTGLPYAIMALLTVFLSVGTVAFEQRDRTIWQTATKPVARWQYLLGKWVGVMLLNLVLLSVTSAGVFLFTEYLRHQPAQGELAYRVDMRGASTRGTLERASTDRKLLETQVLVARTASEPEPATLTGFRVSRLVDRRLEALEDPTPADAERIRDEIIEAYEQAIADRVDRRFRDMLTRQPNLARTEDNLGELRQRVLEEAATAARTVPRGGSTTFTFDVRDVWHEWEEIEARALEIVVPRVEEEIASGRLTESDRERRTDSLVAQVVRSGRVGETPRLTLEYKIQAGGNDPTEIYELRFAVNGVPWPEAVGGPAVTAAALNQTQVLEPIPLWLAVTPADEEGIIDLTVFASPENEWAVTFPPDGLKLLRTVGGYELNFVRVMGVMWIKLGFIAAVGVAMASLVSFPVGCLVTLGILFMAESAGFLGESLAYFARPDTEGDYNPVEIAIAWVARPIAWGFGTYAELRPTERLVSGMLVGWSVVGRAALVVGAWTAAVLGLGVLVLRRRELALYSGN